MSLSVIYKTHLHKFERRCLEKYKVYRHLKYTPTIWHCRYRIWNHDRKIIMNWQYNKSWYCLFEPYKYRWYDYILDIL